MVRVVLICLLGIASQYAPGKMDEVIRVRQIPGRTSQPLPQQLPTVNGYLAVLDCGLIGEVVEVRPEGGEWETFLVADCAGRADGGASWMIRNGIVAEVDYASAVRWGTVGRGIKVEIRQIQRGRLPQEERHGKEGL